MRGKVIHRRVTHHQGVAAFRQRLTGHASAAALPDQAWILQPSEWSRKNRPNSERMTDDELLHFARQLQQHAASDARAPSTRKGYLHWWRVFAEFCEKRGWVATAALIPLPVPVDSILRWVAWLSHRYAASTIDISLAAIASIHKDAGRTSPTTDARVRAAVEGVARTGICKMKKPAIVVTPDHVRMFLALVAEQDTCRPSTITNPSAWA
eukprot:COSAG01_NODE_6494_length_3632_cov_5.575149_1_plen_210_part_00